MTRVVIIMMGSMSDAGTAAAGRQCVGWKRLNLHVDGCGLTNDERERETVASQRESTSRQLTTKLNLISRSIAFPRVLWPSPTVNDIRYLRFGALKRDRDDRIVHVIHVITFEMGK